MSDIQNEHPVNLIDQRFRIVETLSAKKLENVYLVEDPRLNTRYLLKKFPRILSETAAKLVRDEFHTLARLRHPSIPTLVEVFSSDDGVYVIMSYEEGEILQDILDRNQGPLLERDVLPWIEQIFDALSYLHAQRIVHRNITPENIKIIRYGFAQLMDLPAFHYLEEDMEMGPRYSLGFAAPEVYEGMNVDVRTDVYGLAATLYKALTGQTPTPAQDRLSKQAQITPVRKINPIVSINTAAAIEKGLAFLPDERWQTVDEFRNAIKLANDQNKQNQVQASDQYATTTEFILAIPEDEESPFAHKGMTPQRLRNSIIPYLNAIAEVQGIIDEVEGAEVNEVKIKSIQQNSPINITLEGAAKAVQLITDTVIPWRRKHAEAMAFLSEREKQADIESKKAEILEKRARAAKDRAEAKKVIAEAINQQEAAERLKLENEKLRLELHRAKIQLALEMLAQIAPNLSEADKIAYVVRLLPPIDTLVTSELRITTGDSKSA
jgi:serine/threonine protein kinase